MAELYVLLNTLAKASLDWNDIGEEIKRLMQDEWAKDLRQWGQISTFNNWYRAGVELLLSIPVLSENLRLAYGAGVASAASRASNERARLGRIGL